MMKIVMEFPNVQEDYDFDGLTIQQGLDDNDEYSTTIDMDEDCDGVITSEDCDDMNPNVWDNSNDED